MADVADAGKDKKQLALLTARATLISGVAATTPTPEIINAADDAAYADTKISPAGLLQARLWHDATVPDDLALTGFLANGPEWAFWRDWYQGFVDGQPMNWALQQEVALIADAEWNKGAAHIAGLIKRIRLKFRTAVTPRLIHDSEEGVFTVEPEDALAADVLEFACTRIEGVLKNALEAAGANGLLPDSYETITIRRALENHFGRASLLATGFSDACLSLQRNIGSLYPNDTALINLQNALYGVVEEINEQHPKARERCTRLASLASPGPITPLDQAEISLVPERIGGKLDDEARAIIESDVERILAQQNPPKSVRARFTDWVTTVSIWMDKTKSGDERAIWLAGVVSRLVRWWSGSGE